MISVVIFSFRVLFFFFVLNIWVLVSCSFVVLFKILMLFCFCCYCLDVFKEKFSDRKLFVVRVDVLVDNSSSYIFYF